MVDAQELSQDHTCERGNQHMDDIDEKRVKSYDAQPAQNVPALQAEGQYDHAETTDDGNGQVFEEQYTRAMQTMEIPKFRGDKDGCHCQQSIRVFKESLAAFPEEEARKMASRTSARYSILNTPAR